MELNQVDEKRAIVFVNTKNKCDYVSKHLDNLGYRCTVLHGSKTQVCNGLARQLANPCVFVCGLISKSTRMNPASIG